MGVYMKASLLFVLVFVTAGSTYSDNGKLPLDEKQALMSSSWEKQLENFRECKLLNSAFLEAHANGQKVYRLTFFNPRSLLVGPALISKTVVVGKNMTSTVLRNDASAATWLNSLTSTVATETQADELVRAFVQLRDYDLYPENPCRDLGPKKYKWTYRVSKEADGWAVDYPIVVDREIAFSVRYFFVVSAVGKISIEKTEDICMNGGYD
jgi:hypothetical protein